MLRNLHDVMVMKPNKRHVEGYQRSYALFHFHFKQLPLLYAFVANMAATYGK